ncbi:MAG TPA: GNAT family N-acetyltransferase [Candidatus Kapabacteria bacterium]|nr:GNAT family N-acetyltransferase [Candidatus Kapabacteria bacterium]
MRLTYFDAKPHIDDEPVRTLMLAILPHPNEEILDHLLDRYRDDDGMALLGALDDAQQLVAIAGLRLEEEAMATILHLRVADPARRHGVGRALVTKAITHFKLRSVAARCAEEILPFYTALGFEHWLIGEKPPGRKWYGVRWRRGEATQA